MVGVSLNEIPIVVNPYAPQLIEPLHHERPDYLFLESEFVRVTFEIILVAISSLVSSYNKKVVR